MTRDPVIYIFCLAFPVAMLALFAVINHYSGGKSPVFEFPSLIPGAITFSYSFIMLTQCLLVSKDKTTSLLKRLYTSPIKNRLRHRLRAPRVRFRSDSDNRLHCRGIRYFAIYRFGIYRLCGLFAACRRTVARPYTQRVFRHNRGRAPQRKVRAGNNIDRHFRLGHTRRSLDAARYDGRI